MARHPEAIFTPIRPGVLATEVSAQIRERILDGSLEPGQPIKDSVLAETLGLSRSPVREGLRMLEERGLVRKTPNRSYEVISFTEADVDELAMLRIAYESMAARWLVEHGTDLEPLLGPLAAMEPADESDEEKTRVVGADGEFHTLLIELTGLRRLASSYAAIRDQIALMLASGYLMRSEFISTQRERHDELYRRLVAAQRSGDATGLLGELDFHIRGGMGLLPPDAVAERTGTDGRDRLSPAGP